MNVVPFQLNKTQQLLAKGVSQSISRPVLTGIHVRKGIAEVADGTILVQKAVDYDGDPIILDGKQVISCKADKQLGAVSFIPDGDSRVQAVVDGGTRVVDIVPGEFPETDSFFPKSDPVFKIALAKNILSKLLSCLDEKNGENEIAFFFYGTTLPVEFRTEGGTRGLVMPLSESCLRKYEHDSGGDVEDAKSGGSK